MSFKDKPEGIVIPLKGERVVESGGYSVCEWSPDEGHACGPTQVHVLLPIDSIMEGAAVAMRLKSRRAIQVLIDALEKHRDSVWPPH